MVYLIAGRHTPIESEQRQKGPFKNVNRGFPDGAVA